MSAAAVARWYYFCGVPGCGARADHLPDCIHCRKYFCKKHGAVHCGIPVCSECDARINRLAGIQERNYHGMFCRWPRR